MSAVLRIAAFVALLAGCLGPRVERPSLRPERMQFQSMSGNGITFEVTFLAYNPNTFDLPLRNLRAQLTIEGTSSGSGVTAVNTVLPPMRQVPVTTQVTVPWENAPAWAATVASRPVVNYTLNGTVTAEHIISVDTDFTHSGTVPREFFLQGGLNSVFGAVGGGGINIMSSGGAQ